MSPYGVTCPNVLNWLDIRPALERLTFIKSKLYFSQNLREKILKALLYSTYFPDMTSHTDTVWSKDPVISISPAVLNVREMISAVWPWREKEKGFNTHWHLPVSN